MQGSFGPRAETSRSRFPPEQWWSRRINRDLLTGLERVFAVYGISPEFLYSWAHKLGANAPSSGNSLVYVITAMLQAADQYTLELERREDDTSTLEEDDPMLGLFARQPDSATPELQQGRPHTDAQTAGLPEMRTNAAFGSLHPNSASRATRNLSSALDGTAREGGVSAATVEAFQSLRQQVHDQSNTAPRNEQVILTYSDTGVTQSSVQDTNNGSGAASGRTEDPFLQRQHWADRRAAGAPSNLQPAETAGTVNGEPSGTFAQSTQPETLQGTANTGQQSQAELNSAVQEPGSPLRQGIARTTSSPILSTMDLSRIRNTERNAIRDKNLKFNADSYLINFSANARRALHKATHLDKEEKADLLIAMLDEDVKNKLVDRQEIQHPEDPEQIFKVLEAEFPARVAELQIALSQITMQDNETATAFLSRVRSLYTRLQCPLPVVHSGMLAVIMKASSSFIAFCSNLHNLRMDQNRAAGQPSEDYDMRWTNLSDWAMRYDSQRDLMLQVKTRKPTLQSRDLAKNETFQNKIRSGKMGNVSAVETDTNSRGRSQQYNAGSHRNHDRSGSRGSYGSQNTDRSRSRNPPWDRSRSPYRRDAGQTPRSGRRTPNVVEFSKSPSGRDSDSRPSPVAVIQIPFNWISVNLLSTLKSADSAGETDRNPIVISTLPAHIIQQESAVMNVNAVTRRPNNPEPMTQEELDDNAEPLNLPEAMKRGLRQVQNLPVNNPYAKVLGANFYLTFRQLAGLCLDDEFANICRQLLEVSLKREGRQQNMTNARASAEILRMVLAELPHSRTAADMIPVASPEMQAPACSTMAGESLEVKIVRMTELQAHVDDDQQESRKLRLDSGASVSCISETAFQRDKKFLLQHGRVHTLLTPMTLSGFASAHTKVTHILTQPQFIIGNAACRHSFLVVPGLVCDYMLGQDFLLSYDMSIRMRELKADMGVPRHEWLGEAKNFTGSQTIDIGFGSTKACLAVKPQ